MIYKLRNNFIKICAVSLFAVLIIIYAIISLMSINQLNASVDALTDTISANDGTFPDDIIHDDPPGYGIQPAQASDFITKETKFNTRFFVVRLDKDGNIIGENIESISSVSAEEADDYALQVIEKGNSKGWISNFRYKMCESEMGNSIVFVDGTTNQTMYRSFIINSGIVLLCSGIVIMLLIIFFSKRAVKPVAESYEKQNQFITDANHELKTPLTLILTNLDIAESQLGQNEWLDDIRTEGQRMSVLINKLVMLTRMDENNENDEAADFDISEMIQDVSSEYQAAIEESGKTFTCSIPENIHYTGDESSLRKLMSILMDNALKYCDCGGNISVKLSCKRHRVIEVENTYSDVDNTELEKLFDRFYRSDKARTFDGGYGIGLSIAKMIVEKHNGEIKAYKAANDRIGFKITLK